MEYESRLEKTELVLFPNGCINFDPKAKNSSNCDISGSFYEVTPVVSKTTTTTTKENPK
jgi:hypothetical protein